MRRTLIVAAVLTLAVGCGLVLSLRRAAGQPLTIVPIHHEKVESVDNILKLTVAVTNNTPFTLLGDLGEVCGHSSSLNSSTNSDFKQVSDPAYFRLAPKQGQVLAVYVAEHGPWVLAGRYRRSMSHTESSVRWFFRGWGIPLDAPHHPIREVRVQE